MHFTIDYYFPEAKANIIVFFYQYHKFSASIVQMASELELSPSVDSHD